MENKRGCSSEVFDSSLQTSLPQNKRIFFKVVSFSSDASPLQFNSTFNFVEYIPGINKTGLHLPKIKRRLSSGFLLSIP